MLSSAEQPADPKVVQEVEELTASIFKIFQTRNTLPLVAVTALLNEICYVSDIAIKATKNEPNVDAQTKMKNRAQLVANIEKVTGQALQYIKTL